MFRGFIVCDVLIQNVSCGRCWHLVNVDEKRAFWVCVKMQHKSKCYKIIIFIIVQGGAKMVDLLVLCVAG